MRTMRLIRGWWRHIGGFCPKCNCDAPECDTCDICRNYASKVRGQPNSFPFPKVERDVWWIRFKSLLSALVLVSLVSCGPFIDVKHGYVSTGFLSQTQGFSGALKNKDGCATWSVVGSDGTTVANNALMYGGIVSAGNNTLKTVQNNNATATTQQANVQASTLALQQDKEAAAAAGTAAANKAAAQTTARAAGIPALVKP